MVSELAWQSNTGETENTKTIDRYLETPYGQIHWKLKEQKKHGTTPVEYPLTLDSKNIFDIISWYVQQHQKIVKYMTRGFLDYET